MAKKQRQLDDEPVSAEDVQLGWKVLVHGEWCLVRRISSDAGRIVLLVWHPGERRYLERTAQKGTNVRVKGWK